jgi:hypothetical protein
MSEATSRIENMACRALDGTTGMCYSKSECTELDGRSVGLCDDDAGEDGPVCCIGEFEHYTLDCVTISTYMQYTI